MLFKIGDKVYSGDEIPCGVVFENDEEKQKFIEILQKMRPNPGERRWWVTSPKDHFPNDFKEFDQWTTLTEDEAKKMTVIKNSELTFIENEA